MSESAKRYRVKREFRRSLDDGGVMVVPEGMVLFAIKDERGYIALEDGCGAAVCHIEGNNIYWLDETYEGEMARFVSFDNAPSVRRHLEEL